MTARKPSVKLRKHKVSAKVVGIPCPECGGSLIKSDSEAFGIKTCSECRSQFRYSVDPDSGMKEIHPYTNRDPVNREGLRPKNKHQFKGRIFKLADFPNIPGYVKAVVNVRAKMPPSPVIKPGELRCSFCGQSTPHVSASHATGDVRMMVKTETDYRANPVEVRERIYFSSNKIVACSKCAHRIQPIIDRDGKIVNHNVKTYSEG